MRLRMEKKENHSRSVLGSEKMALRARRDSARAKYRTLAKVKTIGLVL